MTSSLHDITACVYDALRRGEEPQSLPDLLHSTSALPRTNDFLVSAEMSSSMFAGVILVLFLAVSVAVVVDAEDPYKFFSWNITYGDIYPLGVRQQGILINGQFPGPVIDSTTNDNLIINVFNNLPEPFLLSWYFLLFCFCCLVVTTNVAPVMFDEMGK